MIKLKEIKPSGLDDLIKRHQEEEKGVYGVIDGAQWPEAVDEMIDQGAVYSCLFQGDYDFNIEVKLPHVFLLNDDVFSQDFCKKLEKNVGILLVTPQVIPIAKVRRALKRFTRVRLPDGEIVTFRFYDPRVLTEFLPDADKEQIDTFYSHEVEAYIWYNKKESLFIQSHVAKNMEEQWNDIAEFQG